MLIKHFLNIIIFFLFAFLPMSTFAVVDIILTPEIPGPYESVKAKIGGFLIDTNRAEIYWYQDEQIRKQGVGETDFEFFTGGIGEQVIVDVIIITETGRRIDKQIIVEPIEVDILWEADTYTPLFYRGKALPTYNSTINAIAIPNIPNPELTKFLYTWKDDLFNTIKAHSGYERNTFSTLAQLSPHRKVIDVEVVSVNRSKRAKKQISVYSREPELIPYEIKPLSGIAYWRTLSSPHEIISSELSVHIAPFYFSRPDVYSNKLSYRWMGAGTEIKNSSDAEANNYTFGRPNNEEGSAEIEIFVINDAEWMQKARKKLTLFYK